MSGCQQALSNQTAQFVGSLDDDRHVCERAVVVARRGLGSRMSRVPVPAGPVPGAQWVTLSRAALPARRIAGDRSLSG